MKFHFQKLYHKRLEWNHIQERNRRQLLAPSP